MRKKTHSEFEQEARMIHGNNYEYLEEYSHSMSKMKMRHIACGHEFYLSANCHLSQRQGCAKCAGNWHKTHEVFLTEARSIHGDEYEYLNTYMNVKQKILMKHIVCGHKFMMQPDKHLNRKDGCPKCRLSKSEKFIANILNANSVKYESQKRFDTCRNKNPLPFDFAIGKVLIEFDGRHHFRMINKKGQRWKSFAATIRHDRIKNKWALENDFLLYRFPYFTPKKQIEEELLKIVGITK